MSTLEILALMFLLFFLAWCCSPPKRGGMSAKGPANPPTKPPKASRDSAWSSNPNHEHWKR